MDYTTITEVNSPLRLWLQRKIDEDGLFHSVNDDWPLEGTLEDLDIDVVRSHHYRTDSFEGVCLRGQGAAFITVYGGSVNVMTYGTSFNHAQEILDTIRAEIPAERIDKDAPEVPIAFWSWSQHGPRQIRRKLDAPRWEDIVENYPLRTRKHLEELTTVTPGVGGQLILMHGVAGTGKTTMLRCLAREWREWTTMHYIVDPESFFGEHAGYMLEVLLGQDESHDFDNEEEEKPRWRVILLEDCGEMLQPDAKQQIGQGLSRLLNACDGMIGRGLRILLIVTTNEPLDKVHEAVSRPGRCAAHIEFEAFAQKEAADWLDLPESEAPQKPTLADLYAIKEGRRQGTSKVIGFAR